MAVMIGARLGRTDVTRTAMLFGDAICDGAIVRWFRSHKLSRPDRLEVGAQLMCVQLTHLYSGC